MSFLRPIRAMAVFAIVFLGVAVRADEPAKAGKRYAVLVGVNTYMPKMQDLSFSEKDVEDLATVLASNGYSPDHIVLMTQKTGKQNPNYLPTIANIGKALKKVQELATPEDVVLVAFSGHGVTIDGKFHFCPHGADPKEAKSLLPIDGVYDELKVCKAGYKMLLADACRNELKGARAVLPTGERAMPAVKKPDDESGVVAFFSCSKGQFAFEDEKVGNGVFFHHVIAGLAGKADANGDKKVTRLELEGFVRDSMETNKQTVRQNPFSAGATNTNPALVEVSGGGGAVVGDEVPGGYERIARMTGHTGQITSVAFSIGGQVLYSASQDGNVSVWDVAKKIHLKKWTHGNSGTRVLPLPLKTGEGVIVAGTYQHYVKLYLPDGRAVSSGTINTEAGISQLIASPDKKLMAATVGAKVVVWTAANGVKKAELEPGHADHRLAFSTDSKFLLTGNNNGDVSVYDLATKAQVKSFSAGRQAVWLVSFLGDGQSALILSGRTVHIWDLKTETETTQFEIDAHPFCFTVSPDAKVLAVGYSEGTLLFYDLAKREQFARVKDTDKQIDCIGFSADGRLVAVGGNDTAVYIYKATGK